jgi:hypothetical protein
VLVAAEVPPANVLTADIAPHLQEHPLWCHQRHFAAGNPLVLQLPLSLLLLPLLVPQLAQPWLLQLVLMLFQLPAAAALQADLVLLRTYVWLTSQQPPVQHSPLLHSQLWQAELQPLLGSLLLVQDWQRTSLPGDAV